MEARLMGPPPAADSEREKKFQKGMYTKEFTIKTWTAIYTRHKLSGTDWTGFVSLSDDWSVFSLMILILLRRLHLLEGEDLVALSPDWYHKSF